MFSQYCRGQIRHAECSRSTEATPKKEGEVKCFEKKGPLMRMPNTLSIKPHYDRCKAMEHSRFSVIFWAQTETGRLPSEKLFVHFS